MAKAYGVFWGAPTETVLEMLNSNTAFWIDVLQRNTAVGTVINSQLDAVNLPEFGHRVPVTMPAGYAFAEGQFTYTAP
jgi:G:T-mismatch repair DNA endonuclease (very short patch repair protein)